ncbi:MAG TPA: tRNA (adenosine(37)-N6)-threonylcarbamoyltransferase complex ATPase subunit type 1 TsaE [Streptosporangiaceae bacterium]|nr:tRNA (adenosine(37)-N6)-threonylcarbamoyltransferase complex ATPase subunit type 1 TsaE [Streptosporangiaceae bacterium]
MSADAGSGGPAPDLDEHVVVSTADEMRALGTRLAALLQAGDLVVLTGPLGAGKTTLAQGIGAGLGVRGHVTSPTFVIARLHPSLRGGPDLVHADAYRLGSRAEVDDLDLDADLATAVTVVEWGEGLVEDLASSFLAVAIGADGEKTATNASLELGEAAADTDVPRTVRVQGVGERWREAAAATAIRRALTAVT